MKTKIVKDLMVPLSDYATVSKNATLLDAVVTLKKAQEDFSSDNLYAHRAILVFDENDNVVGKVSQLDILRSLEPKYDEMLTNKKSYCLGFTRQFQKAMLEQLRLWDAPMDHICQKASQKKVESFMYKPEEGEFVEAEASLDAAIHQLVIGHHQSLLVTENNKIAGILRLTDVFQTIADDILACEL